MRTDDLQKERLQSASHHMHAVKPSGCAMAQSDAISAKLKHVYLKPGEMHFAENPTSVATVLGSCLSVVMFNRRLAIGAICHGLLPSCRRKVKCDKSCAEGLRFVDCSINRMLERFNKKGVSINEIDVKIFGGADMFGESDSNRGNGVGSQNIEIALKMIKELSLKLISSDTGGVRGRKLYFYTHTGDVYLKRLRKNEYTESR